MPTYMNAESMSEKVAIKITPSQRRWLEDHARREQRSMNQIIRMLIEERMAARAKGETRAHVD